jgi:hypothetical protein
MGKGSKSTKMLQKESRARFKARQARKAAAKREAAAKAKG